MDFLQQQFFIILQQHRYYYNNNNSLANLLQKFEKRFLQSITDMKKQAKQHKKQYKKNNNIVKDRKEKYNRNKGNFNKTSKGISIVKNENKKSIKSEPSQPVSSGLQQMPTIQQMLAIPSQERMKKSNEIFLQVKPFLASFLLKKQGSRVTQLLFKWGDKTVKDTIYREILRNWKELIKSKYALYTIAKVAKQYQFPGIVDDFSILQNNRQGAQILQNFLHNNPQTELMKKLRNKINQLQQKAIQGELKQQQILDNMALKSIEKQYYWFRLSKIILKLRLGLMFEQEKEKTIQILVQNVANIVNDQEGVRLFIQLVNNASAKDKKNLVKQYKGHLGQIVQANNVSYVSVIKLIIQTDDTVAINKAFHHELSQLIPQILTCKKAFSLIFSLFSPRNNNFNILGKYEPQVLKTTCKKPEQQRKKQLRESLYEPLIEFLKTDQNLQQIVKNPIESKLIMGVYKSMQQDHSEHYESFLTYILGHFLELAKNTLKSNTFAESVLADNNGSKVVKSILLLQQNFIESYCEQFAKLFTKHLKVVLQTKASFILLAILERGGREHLVREIMKSGIKLDKCVAGQHYLKLIQSLGK